MASCPDSSRFAWLADQEVGGVVELHVARPYGSDHVKLSGDLVPGGSVRSFQWRP